MTQVMNVNVTCPECGRSDSAEIWTSVNARHNPDEAQYLIDGFLFTWTCPSCGHSVTLNHDCLYHDPNRKVMIQYVANFAKAQQAADALAPLGAKGYETRIVNTREQLREKAAICRDGLDDRAVELLKFLLFNKFVAEKKISGACTAYYGALDDDGAIIIEFIGDGQPKESSIPRSLYDSAAEQIPHLGKELLAAFSVDRAWAAKATDKLG